MAFTERRLGKKKKDKEGRDQHGGRSLRALLLFCEGSGCVASKTPVSPALHRLT